ncbi:MAG: DUF4262 domain-containing protein [Acidimicrobiia bacterium]|nr:DUF4262 domain-containing protein [Acidimicrobiia bacterium]
MQTDYLASIENIIARRGWACQAVFECVDDPGAEWVYSIGLEDRGWPEFIVVGLPPDVGARTINQLCDDVAAGIRPMPASGDTLHGVAPNGYPLRTITVQPDIIQGGEWFNVALVRRGSRQGLSAVQLVWPSVAGEWPEETTDTQPLLGDPWWAD